MQATEACWRVEARLRLLSTSAREGASGYVRLTPGYTIAGCHCTWRQMGPKEPIRTLWRTEKFVAPAEHRAPDREAFSPVSQTVTTPWWLQCSVGSQHKLQNQENEFKCCENARIFMCICAYIHAKIVRKCVFVHTKIVWKFVYIHVNTAFWFMWKCVYIQVKMRLYSRATSHTMNNVTLVFTK